jgi:hypothetical protein
MTRRLRTLLAPLLVCVFALGLTSSADAAKRMELAVQDDQVFLKGLANPFTGFEKARELNATWIRVNLTWAEAVNGANRRKQPKNLTYNWIPWDDAVTRARAQGINVELTLTGPAPRWATGNRKKGVYKPKAGKFGAFARSAAEHFGPLGVKRYTIWNEPNLRRWLQPARQSARLYRNLYASAYRGINKASSRNQVLIGETAPYGQRDSEGLRTIAPLKWLRGVTRVNRRYRGHRGSTLRTDGYAHHPYDYKHKPTYRYPGKDNVTLATLGRLTKALSRLRSAGALKTPKGGVPYVYLTEYGYFAAYKYKLPRKKQARYLVKGFRMARKNPRVKQMLQYLLVPPPPSLKFFSTHVMNKNFTPYPAYKRLRSWAAREAARGGIKKNPLN